MPIIILHLSYPKKIDHNLLKYSIQLLGIVHIILNMVPIIVNITLSNRDIFMAQHFLGELDPALLGDDRREAVTKPMEPGKLRPSDHFHDLAEIAIVDMGIGSLLLTNDVDMSNVGSPRACAGHPAKRDGMRGKDLTLTHLNFTSPEE